MYNGGRQDLRRNVLAMGAGEDGDPKRVDNNMLMLTF